MSDGQSQPVTTCESPATQPTEITPNPDTVGNGFQTLGTEDVFQTSGTVHQTSDTGDVLPTSGTGDVLPTSDTRGVFQTSDTRDLLPTSDTGDVLPSSNTGHQISDTGDVLPTSDTGGVFQTSATADVLPTVDTGDVLPSLDTGLQTSDTGDVPPSSVTSNNAAISDPVSDMIRNALSMMPHNDGYREPSDLESNTHSAPPVVTHTDGHLPVGVPPSEPSFQTPVSVTEDNGGRTVVIVMGDPPLPDDLPLPPLTKPEPQVGEQEDGGEQEKEEDGGEEEFPWRSERPRRTIRPVQDKSKQIKLVDSDASSSSDADWGAGGDEEEGGSGSSGSESDSGQETGESEGSAVETEEECKENSGDLNIPPSSVKQGEEEEEGEKKPVTISRDDMPFLFAARAPGKRQVKPIQFSNSMVEVAQVMSSGSSSEDEEWGATTADVDEQADEGESVDLKDVPLLGEEDKERRKKKGEKKKEKRESAVAVAAVLPKVEKEGKAKDDELIILCSVCLGDSDDDDMLSCDSCGVAVHQFCYTGEDWEDEATWVCEVCVAADPEACCEFCPNKGGVMKATDSGKWSHMVCALYLDGTGFGDLTTLSPIVTTDIPASSFGSKRCQLCEDPRFAYTGMVMDCEAGMCRAAFHVTCAQKLGYLEEQPDEDVKTKPFYAYCKIHTDKEVARARRKAYQHHALYQKEVAGLEPSEEMQKVIHEKQMEYLRERRERTAPAVMTEMHPRALFGSVSAFTKLTRKAELHGLDTYVLHADSGELTEPSSRRVDPELSVSYVKQYEMYQSRLRTALSDRNTAYVKQLDHQEEEHQLQADVFELRKHLTTLQKKTDKAKKQVESIWRFLNIADPQRFSIPQCLYEGNIQLHDSVIRQKLGLKTCDICTKGTNPERMVDCNECKMWFHFHCLDPPLTRNPKINKAWAWLCPKCTGSDSDGPLHPVKRKKETPKVASTNGGDVVKKEEEEEPENQRSSKFGRTIRKPKLFGEELVPKEKPKEKEKLKRGRPHSYPDNYPVKKLLKVDRVWDIGNVETVCRTCSVVDNVIKSICFECKRVLHGTCGVKTKDGIVCPVCLPQYRAAREDVKPVITPPPEVTRESIEEAKEKKRKSVFDMEYDLMKKKKKESTPKKQTVVVTRKPVSLASISLQESIRRLRNVFPEGPPRKSLTGMETKFSPDTAAFPTTSTSAEIKVEVHQQGQTLTIQTQPENE